jgi:SAM-dependent methyltransferase
MSEYQDDPTAKSTQQQRREKLLSGVDLENSVGVEIGALCRPIVRREDGEIIYVDHADTQSLKRKYLGDAHVDVEKIVHVDAVWGQNTLQDAVRGRYVDYVVASHVIEHVPDLITWLQEIASILKTTGEVRLIVPDKRFLFDCLRRETSLADVLLSYITKARVPQPHSMLDFALGAAKAYRMEIWRDEVPAKPALHYDWQGAVALARDIIENGNYHDIHCWVFTPKSFADLFMEMSETGLVDFACERFEDTEKDDYEFFVTLRRSNNRDYINQSWQHMSDAASTTAPGEPSWQARRQAEVEMKKERCGHFSPRRPGEKSSLDPLVAIGLPYGFDAEEYLRANADVAAAGANAADHYLLFGWHEGRSIRPRQS